MTVISKQDQREDWLFLYMFLILVISAAGLISVGMKLHLELLQLRLQWGPPQREPGPPKTDPRSTCDRDPRPGGGGRPPPPASCHSPLGVNAHAAGEPGHTAGPGGRGGRRGAGGTRDNRT